MLSDDEAVRLVAAAAGTRFASDPVITQLEPGARDRPWIGNCVAIGEAAVSLEPLDAVQLHVVHTGIAHLVKLFPVSAETFPEAEIYNRAIVSHAANIRDFQIAHYKLNRRFDERLWDGVRDARPPASLEAKMNLFRSRGHVLLYDGESFQDQNWASIFLGHGLMPESYDPRVDLIEPQEHIARVQDRLRTIGEAVAAMPPVAAYLAGPAQQPQARSF